MADRYTTLLTIGAGVDKKSIERASKELSSFTDSFKDEISDMKESTKNMLDKNTATSVNRELEKLKKDVMATKKEIKDILKDLSSSYVKKNDFDKYVESLDKNINKLQDSIKTNIESINMSLKTIGSQGVDTGFLQQIEVIEDKMKEFSNTFNVIESSFGKSIGEISFDEQPMVAKLKAVRNEISAIEDDLDDFENEVQSGYLEVGRGELDKFDRLEEESKVLIDNYNKLSDEIKKLNKERANINNDDDAILHEQALLELEYKRYAIASKLEEYDYSIGINDFIDMNEIENITKEADSLVRKIDTLYDLIDVYSKKQPAFSRNEAINTKSLELKEGKITIPVELEYSFSSFKKEISRKIRELSDHSKKIASNNKIHLEFDDLDKELKKKLEELTKKRKLTIDTNLGNGNNGLYSKIDKAVKNIKEKLKNVPMEIGTITVSDKALESAGRKIIDAVLPAKDLSKAVSEYSKAIDKISNFGKTEKFNFADLLDESVTKTIASIDTLLDRIPQIANELKEVKNAFPDTSKTDGIYATKEDVNNLLALTKQLNDIKVAINELNNRKINIGINPKGFSSIVDELKEVERVMARAFNVKNIDELESDLRQSLKLLEQVKTKQGELSKRGYKQYVPFFEEYDKYVKNGGDKSFADMSWLDDSGNEIKFTAEQLEILNDKYAEYVKYVKEAKKETSADTTDDFTNKQIDNLERLNKIAKDIYDDLQGKTIELHFDTNEVDKFRNAILELKEVLSKAFNVKIESELNKSLVNSLSLLDKVKTKSGELSKRGYKQYIPFFEEYDKYKNAGGNKEFSDISWSGKDGNIIKFTAEQLEVLNKQYAEYNKHKKESADGKLGTDNNITQEINKINELNQSLEVVKTTIKEKNELFEAEVGIVSGSMEKEEESIAPLKNSLKSVNEYLRKINTNSNINLNISSQKGFENLDTVIDNITTSVDNKNASLIAEKKIANDTVRKEVSDFNVLHDILKKIVGDLSKIKALSKNKIKIDNTNNNTKDVNVKDNSLNDSNNNQDDIKETVSKIKFLQKHLKEYFNLKQKIDNAGFDSLSKEEQYIWSQISSGISKAISKTDEYNSSNERVVSALRDFDMAYNKISNNLSENSISKEVKDATKDVKEFYSLVNKLLTLGGNSDSKATENMVTKITEKIKELKHYSNIDLSEIDSDLNSKMRTDFLNKIGKNVSKYKDNADSGKYVNSDAFNKYIAQVKELESMLPINFTDENSIKNIETVINKLSKAEKELNDPSNIKVDSKNLYQFQSRVAKFMQDNSKAVAKYSVDFERIKELMRNINSEADLSNLMAQFGKLEARIRLAGDTGRSAFDTLRERIKSVGATLISYVSVFDLVMYAREVASAVTEVDTALTELVKVSDMSNARLQQSFEKSRDTAKELGATLSDTIQATADWSRLGYNPDQAEELGRIALLYKNVGDNIDIETANQSLISTLQGFQLQADQAESIVDKFNEVANNYAIDSGGIGQALQRSAASFNAANTSLSESIALVTATKLHWLCIW